MTQSVSSMNMTSASRARRRWIGAAIVTGLTVVAGACSSFGKSFKEPVVTVKEFTITGLGVTGGSLDVVLQVYNPNGYKLDALSMTYRVDVDTTQVGEGELKDHFVVPSGDSSTVRMPVRFTYAGLGAAGRSLINSGTIDYRVRGDFTVATPLGNFTRPYDQKGRYSSVAGKGR
jgi:LEA14-like dessication related protein